MPFAIHCRQLVKRYDGKPPVEAVRGLDLLEGKSIVALWPQVVILTGYATITFAVALRVFRWR